MNEPPTKRFRQFSIEQILGGEEQFGGGTTKKAEDYVKKLDNTIEHVPKFQYLKSKSRFSIQDIPADPESLLGGIFQHCIDEAIAEGRERNMEPDHLGCTISSQLLTSDIWIPVRKITEDTVNTILNRFLEVAQSKEQEGITLWGEPFSVTVTTIKKSGLPEKRQLTGGGAKKLANVHHRIHEQCLIKIQNVDGYCLFYAMQATLKHTISGLPRRDFYNYMHNLRNQRGLFQRETDELMQTVGVPPGKQAYKAEEFVPKIVDYWNEKYRGRYLFKAFIFGAMGQYKPLFAHGPDDFEVPIILYFNEGHFDGIQKAGNLFGMPYCFSCEKTYQSGAVHNKDCKKRCIKCSRVGPKFPCKPVANYENKCLNCKKIFFNNDCYDHHLSSNFCKRSIECEKCGKIYDVADNRRNGRKGHECFERYCETCKGYHDPKRGCYIRPLEPYAKRENKPWRLVTFDLETMQNEPIDPNLPEKKKHATNFVVASVVCPNCISSGSWQQSLQGKPPCNVCGEHRNIAFCQRSFRETEIDKQVITSHPLRAFTKWILYELPLKYDTVAISHYGGRFDMVLVFQELFLQGINPTMIRKGNRLFEMTAKSRRGQNPNVVFRDSWNLIPVPLATMVPMFELNVQDKPWFPHLANRPDNYGRQIFPSKDDYLAGGMMPEKRKEFDRWYEVHKNEPFFLDEALASYCKNDVEILTRGLIAFRAEFLEMTRRSAGLDGKADRVYKQTPHSGIDPVRDCITISSACMRHFRTNYLQEDHLAIVPERGYDGAKANQSLLAFKFMNWYSKKHNVQIQNARSEEGEKRIGNYQLDGWIEAEQKGLEVNGCVWHACETCYPDPNKIMTCGKSAGRIREQNKRRMDFIRSKLSNIEIIWECQIAEMLRKDPEMKKCFDNYNADDDGPLDIRACFFGGRTGPLKLYYEALTGKTISYYDFTSLYPFINFITKYPVGHPRLHILNKVVKWERREDNPYPLALMKVLVVPPRQIDVPVLPVKISDRLCFPSCITCCKKFPHGAVMEDYGCEHSDEERGFVCSCTSLELDAALDAGYVVTKVLRVLEYELSDDKLFRRYISELMREKMHASGFDEGIRGNREAEDEFIRECAEMFDIFIDRDKMVPNKGKRALSKLMLNNLWGRFSLRNFGLSQTLITDDPSELCNYLENKSIEVSSVDKLTKNIMLISYIQKREWIEEHACSNVVISLFTTSAARLHLLKSMQKVVNTPGCELLYTDTDSLIYSHPTDNNPLQTGPHLGQFTNEYPKHHIIEYCSGGAKQYGLKLLRKGLEPIPENFEYVLKVRGITLNEHVMTDQGLRYETFKNKVLHFANTGEAVPIKLLYPNFLRPSIKIGSIITQPLKKIYKPYVGKGIVRSRDYKVLDFGHIEL